MEIQFKKVKNGETIGYFGIFDGKKFKIKSENKV